jgi:hypothetical protein
VLPTYRLYCYCIAGKVLAGLKSHNASQDVSQTKELCDQLLNLLLTCIACRMDEWHAVV